MDASRLLALIANEKAVDIRSIFPQNSESFLYLRSISSIFGLLDCGDGNLNLVLTFESVV